MFLSLLNVLLLSSLLLRLSRAVQKKGPVVHQNDPSPEANPWSKKSDFEIASHDKPFSKYPPAGGPDKWPGLPRDKMDILHPSNKPLIDMPYRPFGIKKAKNTKNNKGDTWIAGSQSGPRNTGGKQTQPDQANIKWPRDQYPDKKAPP